MYRFEKVILVLFYVGMAVVSSGQTQLDSLYYKDGRTEVVNLLMEDYSSHQILVKTVDGEQRKVEKYLIEKIVTSYGDTLTFENAVPPKVKSDKKKVLIGLRASIPFSGHYTFIPVDLSIDVPIVDLGKAGFLSVGGRVGLDRQRLGDPEGLSIAIQQYCVDVLVGYHYPIQNLDLYAKPGIGLYHRRSALAPSVVVYVAEPEKTTRPGASMTLGAAYYFLPLLGLSADFSIGPLSPQGSVSLGVAFKF